MNKISVFYTLLLFISSTISAQTPTFSWTKSIQGATATSGLAAEISDFDADPAGNAYITGQFRGS